MPHAREQIRGAIVTALTGLTTTGSRVYASRALPLTAADLPALCVYTRTDTPDYAAGVMANRPRRILQVHIEGYVDGDDQDVLDDIAAEVETALYGSATLGALVGGIELGEQVMRVDGEGSELVSVIDLVFNMSYSTAEGTPGTVLKG